MTPSPAVTPLPAPLHEALHILPPWLSAMLCFGLLVVVLGVLVGWWLWRRRRYAHPSQPTLPPRQPESSARSLAERIDALRREYLKNGLPRDGCHALAKEIKIYLERRTGHEVEEMTVAEIVRRFADHEVGSFFTELREQQFGRHPPDAGDLERLSRRAIELFATRDRFRIVDGD